MNTEETTITPEKHQVIQFPVSLRDYFAAKALAAYLTQNGGYGRPPMSEVAETCYAMSDAMLAEREKDDAK